MLKLLEGAWIVPSAPKFRQGEVFKDFKPYLQILVNRKSGFFAAKHVTLMDLKFKTIYL